MLVFTQVKLTFVSFFSFCAPFPYAIFHIFQSPHLVFLGKSELWITWGVGRENYRYINISLP